MSVEKNPSASRTRMFRRWTQFGLRGMFVVVSAIAISLGGYLDGVRRQQAVAFMVRQHGGYIGYEFEGEPLDQYGWRVRRERAPPSWFELLLGDDFFHRVVEISLDGGNLTDDDLTTLAGAVDVETLRLSNWNATDRGLKSIASLPRLESLRFQDVNLNGLGFARLSAVPRLRRLMLWNSDPAIEIELASLTSCPKLNELSLFGPAFSDKALEQLKSCRQLQELSLIATRVTLAGKHTLEAELPNIEIESPRLESLQKLK